MQKTHLIESKVPSLYKLSKLRIGVNFFNLVKNVQNNKYLCKHHTHLIKVEGGEDDNTYYQPISAMRKNSEIRYKNWKEKRQAIFF